MRKSLDLGTCRTFFTLTDDPPSLRHRQRTFCFSPEFLISHRLPPPTPDRTMSWQSYVDDHLMCELPHGGTLMAAAIVGQDGAVWAQSASFPAITPEQVQNLITEFDTVGHLASGPGMWVGDLKFMVVQGDEGAVIRGRIRKDEEKNIEGKSGCVKKTASALVIGISQDPVTPGDCNVVVENLGDYLLSQGI